MGFWGCHPRFFCDVRVFNIFAKSNQSSSLAANFCKHESKKHCAYEEHIQEVERDSFTPLMFFSSGGMAKPVTVIYCFLASFLSYKWNSPYSLIMGWLCFSLNWLLTALILIDVPCGSCSSLGSPGVSISVDFIVAKEHLATSSDRTP